MWKPRFERFKALVERRQRPGGMYPVLALARAKVSDEERAAMAGVVRSTELAAPFSVWSDQKSSAADRALSICTIDPAFAHVHALIGDVVIRCDDAHAAQAQPLEKFLPMPYFTVRRELTEDFEKDSEMYATRRGLTYWLGEVEKIVEPKDAEVFARGLLAWSEYGSNSRSLSERTEAGLKHTEHDVAATLNLDAYLALECPEVLTQFGFRGPVTRVMMETLVRSPHIKSFYAGGLSGDEAEVTQLLQLPIETMALSLAPNVGFPAWLRGFPSLRSLTLRFDSKDVPYGRLATPELPPDLRFLEKLEHLQLHGVRLAPTQLGALKNLKTLVIEEWGFDRLPDSIVKLEKLESIRVRAHDLLALPEGFEQLRALRTAHLGFFATDELPPALHRMPWLESVQLVAARDWTNEAEKKLRASLPNAKLVSVAFTGPVLRARGELKYS